MRLRQPVIRGEKCMRQLYRPFSGRMIAGVCAGLAQYLRVDPTIVRLVWVLLSLFLRGLGGIVLYVLAWIIIPEEGSRY